MNTHSGYNNKRKSNSPEWIQCVSFFFWFWSKHLEGMRFFFHWTIGQDIGDVARLFFFTFDIDEYLV